MPKKVDGNTVYTDAPHWGGPTPSEPVEVIVEAPKRRLVKLPGAEGAQRTIYLVEDGVRYPIASSDIAAALGIKLEAVDEETLRQWPQGDTYTGA